MKIGRFVPCYVDAFDPEAGVATLERLERLGLKVVDPFDQTCCGRPMTHAGSHAEAVEKARASTCDIVECLHDILEIDALPWTAFPHRVAYHHNYRPLRGLFHATVGAEAAALLQAARPALQGARHRDPAALPARRAADADQGSVARS